MYLATPSRSHSPKSFSYKNCFGESSRIRYITGSWPYFVFDYWIYNIYSCWMQLGFQNATITTISNGLLIFLKSRPIAGNPNLFPSMWCPYRIENKMCANLTVYDQKCERLIIIIFKMYCYIIMLYTYIRCAMNT